MLCASNVKTYTKCIYFRSIYCLSSGRGKIFECSIKYFETFVEGEQIVFPGECCPCMIKRSLRN